MNKALKKIAGIALIIVGLLALVTPFTPGSWLVFVGLQLLGFRLAFWQSIMNRKSQKHRKDGAERTKKGDSDTMK